MIDFVKLTIKDVDVDYLLKSKHFDFIGVFNRNSGELFENKFEFVDKKIKFKLYNNSLYVQGSLHKYKNDGFNNYDVFDFKDLNQVIRTLENNYKINADDCIITNLEIGVNLHLNYHPNIILNHLICHRSKRFMDVDVNGNYKQVKHQRYIIKVYDKGTQYHLNEYMMRYELKLVKSIQINKLGIHTLKDIKNKHWHNKALEMLVEKWCEIIMFDETIKTYDDKWRNPYFWIELNKHQRKRELDKYKKALTESDNLQLNISNMIKHKWNELCY